MCEMVEKYQKANPDKEVVVVDIYNYFELVRQDLEWK
jgi:FMN-dependent NADH-azoreductase